MIHGHGRFACSLRLRCRARVPPHGARGTWHAWLRCVPYVPDVMDVMCGVAVSVGGARTEGWVVDGPPDDRRQARWLGERLRHVRQQQDLSLHDVEERSDGELKASVVGAYERGERTISITRLERLAAFYRVPVSELLPEPSTAADPAPRRGDDRVVIDLVALESERDREPVLVRYVESIRSRRGDFNGRVLTVRVADLETLAAVMESAPDELRERLTGAGLIR